MKKIFFTSLLISIWLVVLFWGKNIGLSMLLLIVPFIYFLINLLEFRNQIKYKKSKILIIPIVLLSSTYFIFNNLFFNTLNLIVIPALIILMVIEFMEKSLNIDKFCWRFMELVIEPLTYIEETMKNYKEDIFLKFKMKTNDKKESNVVKGLLITIPIVLIIIVLLASADEIFGKIFIEMLNTFVNFIGKFELSTIILKLALIAVLFIYSSSFFYHILLKYKPEDEEIKECKYTENTTIKMILGTLNIVYVLFCFIQIHSLFMGKGDVINYSQYARKGFFQLMIVSFINLVVILIAKKHEKNKFINVMSLIMIFETFIILLSSAYRMHLYESAYGYTRLRLLVYVALLTETILLIPTIIYVIDKKINLQKVYIGIIISMYLIVNFSNIDNIIAKNNVDRYFQTGVFDLEYIKKETDTDAIKQLIRIRDSKSNTPEEEIIRENVTKYLSKMHESLENEKMDFRDFNLSKVIAKYLY